MQKSIKYIEVFGWEGVGSRQEVLESHIRGVGQICVRLRVCSILLSCRHNSG